MEWESREQRKVEGERTSEVRKEERKRGTGEVKTVDNESRVSEGGRKQVTR